MAVNKRKVLEAARKFAQKGAKEKALKEYEKLLKLDPRDAKLRLELGDAYRRWGQTVEAIETYNKVADQYMKEGFDARAVAVFKQILNLDPDNFASYEPLAELYQRMGLNGEATAALQTAADGFYKAGDKQAALGMLQKMATMDPTNTTSRIKVADLLHQEGMDSEALLEYDAVADELQRQSDSEGAAKVYERILDIQPDRVETLVAYSRNLINRGAHEAAEPFAKRALEADPEPDQYELLGEVYRLAGRDEDLVALYRKLAELYRERGDEDRTREILQRYVPPDDFTGDEGPADLSDDSAADDLMADAGADLDLDSDVPFDDSTMLDEDLLTDESLLIGDGESGFGVMPGLDSGDSLEMVEPTSGPESNENTRILPDSRPEAPADTDQMFAEASVYLRYGKRDQAIGNLEAILEREPNHRAAMEKLGEAHAEAGNPTRAIELWGTAAKVAIEDGEAEAAAAIRERIALLDPSAAPPVSDPDTAEAPIPMELELDEGPPVLDGSGDDLDVGEIELDDIEVDIDAGSFVKSASASGAAPAAEATASASPESLDARAEAMTVQGGGASSSAAVSINEDLEEADFYYQQGLLEEAEAIYARVLEIAPNHPHAMVRMGEVAAQRGEDPGSLGMAAPTAGGSAAGVTEAPDESAAVDLGEELASWDEDGADELEIAGPVGDAAEPEEEELSAADLSIDLSLGETAPPATVEVTEPAAVDIAGDVDIEDVEIDIELDDDAAEMDLDSPGEAAPEIGDPSPPVAVETTATAADPIEGPDVSDAPDAPDATDSPDEWVSGLADQAPPEESLPPDPAISAGPGSVADDLLGTADDDAAASAFPSEAASDDSTGQVHVDVPAVSDAPVEPVESSEPSDPLHADTSVDFDEIDEVDAEQDVSDYVPVPDSPAPSETAPLALAAADSELEQTDDTDTDTDANADGDFGFDLAAEIGQALDEDANSSSADNMGTADDGFAAVFAEFKKGVSETLSEGDHEAHYDLGIAYREMGLLDDAISEFRASMGHPDRRLGSQHMMALCQLDAGQTEDAIANLQMALSTDGVEGELELALRLDLGRAHEQAGDIETAREAYLAVQSADPNFADVGARMAGLDDPDKQDADLGSDETGEYQTFEGFLDDDDDAADDAPEAEEPEAYEDFAGMMDDLDDEDDDDPSEDEAAAEPMTAESLSTEPDAEPVLEVEPEALAPVAASDEAADEGAELEPLEAEPEILAEPEALVEVDPEPEIVAEVEPEPEIQPEPESEPESEPEPKPKRKKRKISFF